MFAMLNLYLCALNSCNEKLLVLSNHTFLLWQREYKNLNYLVLNGAILYLPNLLARIDSISAKKIDRSLGVVNSSTSEVLFFHLWFGPLQVFLIFLLLFSSLCRRFHHQTFQVRFDNHYKYLEDD